ncbi:hypothetical protein ACP8HZ_04235 [Francisella noatunensis]
MKVNKSCSLAGIVLIPPYKSGTFLRISASRASSCSELSLAMTLSHSFLFGDNDSIGVDKYRAIPSS